jgi:hypothetical protein
MVFRAAWPAIVIVIVTSFAGGAVVLAHKSKLPGQGHPCDPDGRCARKLTCVRYRGVAGERGPEFNSCELRCSATGKCPAGQQCLTIADGPGRVCRAKGNTDVPKSQAEY